MKDDKKHKKTTDSSKLGDNETNVIIVGGGHAGLTLACLLGTAQIHTIVIDNQSPSKTLSTDFDGRTTAISFGSREIMRRAEIWNTDSLEACAIEKIDILDGASQGALLEFDVHEVGKDAFGWIIENRILRQAMYDRINDLSDFVQLIAPASVTDFVIKDDIASVILDNGEEYTAQLIIGCDGRRSFTREWMGIDARQWSYKQRAIVCCATHENPHNNHAIEHFRSEGPFAVLPMLDDEDGNHRSSIVWTEHEPFTKTALDYPEDVFNHALTARFPDWYGKVKLAGKRYAFPLNLVHSHEYIAPRMALVAEAAHGIHPIAGQGLNMSMRDLDKISELLSNQKLHGGDFGDMSLLKNYQKARRFDNMAMAGTTDSLNRLFSNNVFPIKMARKAGLRMVSRIKPAKHFFMKQAMGSAGVLPAIMTE